MNLTQITSQVGSTVLNNLPFVQLPKVKKEKGEVSCSAKLVFDLQKIQLYFKFHSRDKTEQELFYFGNNKGASAQIFLVRALKDVRYLLGPALSDLFLELKKFNMQNCELGQILKDLQKAELYVQLDKVKGGYVANDKWREYQGKKVYYDKNKGTFVVSEQVITIERMIRDFEELNPQEKIVVIIPSVVLPDGSELALNEHPDYHLLVRKSMRLEMDDVSKLNKTKLRICHLCRCMMPQVASDKYLAKLSRTGLNKIFTTTTINTAKGIKKTGFDDSYAICQKCYGKLSQGERYIADNLSVRIAGESVFILPEGLQKPFTTYDYFPKIKDAVDFVFKVKDAKKWYDEAEIEAENQFFPGGGYTINLVFYRSDGKSIKVLDTLEDVPPFRIIEIMKFFGTWKDRMREQTKSGMSLGKVYRIIPVRSNKKKEQLDIQRVLDVYKSLLLRQLINPRLLFQYAMESIGKGLSQIHRQKYDIYRNLPYYAKEGADFYLRDTIMNHLVLMQVLQKTDVLLKPIFRKDVVALEQTFQNEKVQESIQRMENFIQEQGFSAEARGLFYLGALLHRVALAQYSKGHKSKPILKKINFQGMKSRDLQRLFLDLTEKLLQYRRMTAFTDALISQHQMYYGHVVASSNAELDELQNVFFLLTGYSYMVSSKVPDANSEEIQAQQGIMSEEEIGQEETE
ncbi:TM1802 family CRISPR-associated protein [Desulfotruncus alcoholivorax]|uniref:TM1802 family CRISPR-associated protein n=1 Tax=Desulfotruncus alcoholivorax TaxID=265477 RepID=UPI0004129A89|nr:TM1802 family CRISPR-associated protein [Desulfotruncus alcoholivorax]